MSPTFPPRGTLTADPRLHGSSSPVPRGSRRHASPSPRFLCPRFVSLGWKLFLSARQASLRDTPTAALGGWSGCQACDSAGDGAAGASTGRRTQRTPLLGQSEAGQAGNVGRWPRRPLGASGRGAARVGGVVRVVNIWRVTPGRCHRNNRPPP